MNDIDFTILSIESYLILKLLNPEDMNILTFEVGLINGVRMQMIKEWIQKK